MGKKVLNFVKLEGADDALLERYGVGFGMKPLEDYIKGKGKTRETYITEVWERCPDKLRGKGPEVAKKAKGKGKAKPKAAVKKSAAKKPADKKTAAKKPVKKAAAEKVEGPGRGRAPGAVLPRPDGKKYGHSPENPFGEGSLKAILFEYMKAGMSRNEARAKLEAFGFKASGVVVAMGHWYPGSSQREKGLGEESKNKVALYEFKQKEGDSLWFLCQKLAGGKLKKIKTLSAKARADIFPQKTAKKAVKKEKASTKKKGK